MISQITHPGLPVPGYTYQQKGTIHYKRTKQVRYVFWIRKFHAERNSFSTVLNKIFTYCHVTWGGGGGGGYGAGEGGGGGGMGGGAEEVVVLHLVPGFRSLSSLWNLIQLVLERGGRGELKVEFRTMNNKGNALSML